MQSNIENLIKKYFWFLVDEFGFTYNEGKFTSANIEITITYDRDRPTIDIRPRREPDFTKLQIDWVVDYFKNSEFTKTLNLQFGELEENIKTFASIFKMYSNRLLFEIDDWWIPAHKYRLKQWEALFATSPLDAFKEIYDYLDSKEK